MAVLVGRNLGERMTWLAIKTAQGTIAWNLGDVGEAQLEPMVMRGRIAAGVPAGDIEPGQVSLHHLDGPNDRFFKVAAPTVRDAAELQAIDPAAVQSYRDQCIGACRQIRLEEARRAAALLTDADKATLRAELEATTATKAGTSTGGKT